MHPIDRINVWLKDAKLSETFYAFPIVGKAGYWILENDDDTMIAVYSSPSGCYRALCLLDDTMATREQFLAAIAPNCCEDAMLDCCELQPDGGYLWIG